MVNTRLVLLSAIAKIAQCCRYNIHVSCLLQTQDLTLNSKICKSHLPDVVIFEKMSEGLGKIQNFSLYMGPQTLKNSEVLLYREPVGEAPRSLAF